MAGNAATGASVGGTSAGAWGRLRGDAGESALAGAAAGRVRGAIKSSETSPVYKNFVQKCLRDCGHEVIGWR